MKEEDRKLLLKDLCARLPYGVKFALKNSEAYHHENVAKKGDVTIDKLKGFNGSYFSIYHDNPLDWDWYVSDIDVEDVKPYLFPLSSMTEEQDKEYALLQTSAGREGFLYAWNCATMVQWLIENHFDFNGLIPKGLAIDATNKNIY